MFSKILVPLDGSKLAECVLDYVEEIAKGYDTGEVILISVTERVSGRTHPTGYTRIQPEEPVILAAQPSQVPVTFGKKQQQAERYLARIARRLDKKGIKVKIEVLSGEPAEEIVHYARANDCGLITMASHGRSGISRWAYGSVADKILRASTVPVLIVKAPGSKPGS